MNGHIIALSLSLSSLTSHCISSDGSFTYSTESISHLYQGTATSTCILFMQQT